MTSALCPDCQHEAHGLGDRECETAVHHGPSRMHRCLCLARPGAQTACPPQLDCQGGTLGYADIWCLQRGQSLRAVDGRTITPDILTAAPPTHRRLTEAEHDRAWHAIEGAAGEDGADPGTVLAAVLRALDIDPPEAAAHHCDNCEGIDAATCLANPDRPTGDMAASTAEGEHAFCGDECTAEEAGA
ncbi:hypothetical protein ACFWNE_07660 [Streptomyces goshikiensis]|uniref:hypothetical protein n=1 Tax=Streptomyces goshikiensis TaxID=1942 RepID=UPI003657A802